MADVITCNTNVGLGAKARVGPVQAGLIAELDTVGLRGGRIVGSPNGFAYQFLLGGIEMTGKGMMKISANKDTNNRGKDYFVTNIIVPVKLTDDMVIPASYYTQIEVVVSVGGGLRLGFNPGELVDLILGMLGLDIYGDDVCVDKKMDIEFDHDKDKGVALP